MFGVLVVRYSSLRHAIVARAAGRRYLADPNTVRCNTRICSTFGHLGPEERRGLKVIGVCTPLLMQADAQRFVCVFAAAFSPPIQPALEGL